MGDYFNFFYGVISALVVGFYIGYAVAHIRTRKNLMEEVINAREEVVRLKALVRLQVPELAQQETQPHPAYVGHKRCLACGEYHYDISGLPCPKMTPVARGGEHG